MNKAGIEGLFLNEGIQEGLMIRGNTGGVPLCQCFNGTLRDSVVVALPESSTGAVGIISNGGTAAETLRNDTIYSQSEEDPAIQLAQQSVTTGLLTLNAYNTIAINVAGGPDVNASQRSAITMHNSDYARPTGAGTVTDVGGHVTSPPLFVKAAGGDFAELVGSPTIDAGLTEAANGPADFEGNPRVAGAATDIGAFEYQLPKPKSESPAPKGPAPPAAPVIGNATQSRPTWREGNKPAQISKRRPPVGTTFSFVLNEQASVTFTFTRRVLGRKVGHRCVVKSHKNAKRRACKRTVTVGTLSFTGHAGTNRVVFQGRVSSSNKLKPGRYTLVISATNSAGQTARSRNPVFSIVK